MRILLDVCCGPCSTYSILYILRSFSNVKLSLYFSNSNLFPKTEYYKRLEAAQRVANEYDLSLFQDKYNHEAWLDFIKGYESEPEGGKRCEKCYEFRFLKAYKYFKMYNLDKFTTTLTISRFKDSTLINNIGRKFQGFLPLDLKKGFSESVSESKRLGLYRQRYCGCEFSRG